MPYTGPVHTSPRPTLPFGQPLHRQFDHNSSQPLHAIGGALVWTSNTWDPKSVAFAKVGPTEDLMQD